MLSLNKLVQTTKLIFSPRLAASLQSAQITHHTKTLEEKLGLPKKPKKPLTPYFRYMVNSRDEIKQANPGINAKEIVQHCARNWAEVDENLKKKLTEEYLKEKEQYIKQRSLYESNLTDDQRYDIEAAKHDLEESREKRALKKKIRETNKPKKPASGFLFYLSEMNAKKVRDGMEYKAFLKKLGNEWNQLPEEKKRVYNESSKAAHVLYEKELAKWETEMIRIGNLDLVRQDTLIENDVENRYRPGKVRGRPTKSD